MIDDFLTGLQFLTGLRLTDRTKWSENAFGRSVGYFPLVGLIIGAFLAGFYYLAISLIPKAVLAVLVIILAVILTGGLHCDGLMDTADGIFSGRNRERILEIMKDSRIGSNGVIAFVLIVLLKLSVIITLEINEAIILLLLMPVVGRMAMVIVIMIFPYARPEGTGRVFAERADRYALALAFCTTLLIFGATNYLLAWIGLFGALIFAIFFGYYVYRLIGGLTGDVYGAVTEVAETIFILIPLVIKQ